MENYIGFAILLFSLSMICERLADLLKHYLGEGNTWLSRKLAQILQMGDTVTKSAVGSNEEDKRYYRILKINILCGFITAYILHADIFTILNNIEKPGEVLTWKGYSFESFRIVELKNPANSINFFIFLIGCFCTGLFISFGSKFWHDLLDILLQIKNTKRVLAEGEIFKQDKASSIENALKTYQSDFIKMAFQEFKKEIINLPDLNSVSLKSDAEGFYFEVISKKKIESVKNIYEYMMESGLVQKVRVISIVQATEETMAHGANLASAIFNSNTPDEKGTLGCIVTDQQKKYLLTCCHNLLNVHQLAGQTAPAVVAETLADAPHPLGTLSNYTFDDECDSALVSLSDNAQKDIENWVPGMGQPTGTRNIGMDDLGKTRLFFYGFKSHLQSGTVTGVYCDIKINYGGQTLHSMRNLIAISNNGKGLSAPGDSGAIVLDANNKAVGIVVAGSNSCSYIIPISTILKKHNINLV